MASTSMASAAVTGDKPPGSGSKKKNEKKFASKEESRFLSSIMGVMNNLRKQGTLCDVILVVQGKHIPAHRVVLAAASHFFSLMFTTSMMESTSHEVELRSAEPEIIELLVEFVYTARISVNSSNVQSLLDAANQYQIEPVKKMCVDFLKEQVDATNCLGISALAECLDCPELKLSADDFIHQHFTEVYKLDEFLQLNVTQLTQLLHQDTLTVRAEDQIYESAVRWLKYDVCNRQSHMVEVLGCVRFPLVSKAFLSKTVQAEPLIQDNPECLKMVISPPTPRDSLAACASQGKIYTSGGSEVGSSALNLFECYDTRCESWQTKASMLMPRCSHGSVEANGLIYVCGGSLGNNVSGRVLSNCEVYDSVKEEWRELSGMREARKNHGLVFVNNRIYAVGGMNGLGGLDSVEYYDIGRNEWHVAAAMPWRGMNVRCAAVSGVIYVLAGFQGVGRLGHILEYHTDTDRWVTCSKVRAFPVTSCLICVVDTCGAKEEETESTHTHTVPPSSSTA